MPLGEDAERCIAYTHGSGFGVSMKNEIFLKLLLFLKVRERDDTRVPDWMFYETND